MAKPLQRVRRRCRLFLFLFACICVHAVSSNHYDISTAEEERHRHEQQRRRRVAGTTACPTLAAIPLEFRTALKASQTNVFYPSAYFAGSSVRLLSASGLRSYYHPMLCVDGRTTATTITLRDDGMLGDSLANDGIFTRACVHFCQAAINYTDVYNYAFHQTFSSADLIVVRTTLQGKIPYHVIQSPKYPKATVYATSHAAFFVDAQRYYLPGWPTVVGSLSDMSGARNIPTSAILDIFGDVFDWFSMTPFDFNMMACANCRAIPGAYNIKFHGWQRQGGITPNGRVGDLGDCDFTMTGFPILRMTGGVSNEDMLTETLGQMHEYLHGASGFAFQQNFAAKARVGDGMHVPGACTTDHSQLQGPLWDWVKGYPNEMPVSYCWDLVKQGKTCWNKNNDVVRLEANSDCNSCPDANLTQCCSFRYEDAINTRSEMINKPKLFQAAPILQYIAGVLPYSQVPADRKTYYCMGSDTDGGCGETGKLGPCTILVNDTNRLKVTSTYVSRFTLDELIISKGGLRDPAVRAERDYRVAPILVGQRVPSEAEMVYWTQFWRYQEQETQPWERANNINSVRRIPIVNWAYTTAGRSTMHARYHNILCGGGLQVKSCIANTTVCTGVTCGQNAQCYPYDGRPLCVCNAGFWGDGNVCVSPSVPKSYGRIYPHLWSAHDIYNNGSTLEYYPKWTVREWCFGYNNTNNWPSFTAASRIAPYPGGLPKYALKGCGTTLVCKLTEQCVNSNSCVPYPTNAPTRTPTKAPTKKPTKKPTMAPTKKPTKSPTKAPTKKPTMSPTKAPTKLPTKAPTKKPTLAPTKAPTKLPTMAPTNKPTNPPTKPPTKSPTKQPSPAPQGVIR